MHLAVGLFLCAIYGARVVGQSAFLAGQMLDSLTLPSLEIFAYFSYDDNPSPVWPSDSFLALADRSRFGEHLVRLEIRALVTDAELLCCLLLLPWLEDLVVFDSPPHIFITDTLLQAPVCTSSTPPLVPRLDYLRLSSVLGFTDSVLVDVITSRMMHMRMLSRLNGVFQADVWWFLARQPEMSPETLAKLSELVLEGGFNFESGLDADDGYWR
ncbi:hypothetical protein DFH08DRAFT_903845 [Mycena albidolilacea]|uniref:Uncharacterized protein n=1 Tax=Mycena albidolilacea TaxID=1033008 RepID=A0AAD6Z1K9_9AGAR|nr:hypothetical protein DFH08DRAFT_903845 [Mycena albidolilacea]